MRNEIKFRVIDKCEILESTLGTAINELTPSQLKDYLEMLIYQLERDANILPYEVIIRKFHQRKRKNKMCKEIKLENDDYFELRASIGIEGVIDIDKILRKRGYKLLFKKEKKYLEAQEMF